MMFKVWFSFKITQSMHGENPASTLRCIETIYKETTDIEGQRYNEETVHIEV